MLFFRILSIDPGTVFTGFTILDIDTNGLIHLSFVGTANTEVLIAKRKSVTSIHSGRYNKINMLGSILDDLIDLYRPNVVVSEAPYLGRFPQSFAALTELLYEFRSVVYNKDPSMYFITIDPSSVKKAMGVSGKSGDKSLMRKALSKQKMEWTGINIDDLDEHAIDSTAVGLWYAASLSNNI